jgi:formyltetrahydrofolate deformylase
VSGFLAGQNCNINTSHQYGDPESKLFFMRVSFKTEQGAPDELQLVQRFEPVAQQFSMNWRLHSAFARSRVLIMVSKQGHCLHDLLYRTQTGELPMNIAGIASNHEDFRTLANWHDIPYHYLPVTSANKTEQEQSLRNIMQREKVDLVILARYMQILSPGLSEDLSGRCINIHHSFLPSFSGARPYYQAHAHGVKLIGATAHYVTANLDEGPIIEQDVERVDHSHTPEDLASIGRDIEALVLAKAVKYHIEHRILINGNKTVVLR